MRQKNDSKLVNFTVFSTGILKFVGAIGMIAATLYLADPRAVWAQLQQTELRWVVAGILVSTPCSVLAATRWWIVANRIGAPMGFRQAIAEYYLGNLTNQVLPSGVAGAALRAVRHSRRTDQNGSPIGLRRALWAVIIDRVIGLWALASVAFVSALLLLPDYFALAVISALGAILIAILALGVVLLTRRSERGMAFSQCLYQGLVPQYGIVKHAAISLTLVVLLVLTFYVSARATNAPISLARTLFVAPLILGAMNVPLSIAGWGVREAAAAYLFVILGLAPATGVTVSVTYGLIGILASSPGIAVWLWRRM